MSPEEIELERLRIRRNRERFWVGTVVIGVISLIVNSSIQNSKLEHEKIKQDNEHLSKFVGYAISKDLEERRDIAEYFSTMSYTQGAQKRWSDYLNSINTLVDLKYSLLNDIEVSKSDQDKLYEQLSEAKLALIGDSDNSKLRETITILINEINGKQTTIEEKTQQLKKIQPLGNFAANQGIKPNWLSIAEQELNKNIVEMKGPDHNPEILKYSADLGLNWVTNDEVPWSAFFINWCLEEAGIEGSGRTNNRAFMNWGVPLEKPKPGCVIVYWRESEDSWKAHAGFYIKDEGDKILTLGGNQANSVCIAAYSKDQILGYRWPIE